MSLKREDILKAQDLPRKSVDVPEWGGSVLVRGLSGVERDAFEASVVSQEGKRQVVNMKNLRARLVALACVDEEGKALFAPEDAEALGKKSASALERVFKMAQKLSGMTEDDMKELSEGFKPAQSGGSTSA